MSSRTFTRFSRLVLVAALVPAAASAQFTTFIAPANKVKDSVKAAIVAEQKATQDSVNRAQITDMKTWVDSAAGLTLPQRVSDSMRVDTSMLADPARLTPATLANGAVAPHTATQLPLLLVLGTIGVVIGAGLIRRPGLDRARVRRD